MFLQIPRKWRNVLYTPHRQRIVLFECPPSRWEARPVETIECLQKGVIFHTKSNRQSLPCEEYNLFWCPLYAVSRNSFTFPGICENCWVSSCLGYWPRWISN